MAVLTPLLKVTRNVFKGYAKDTLKMPDNLVRSAEEYFDMHPSATLFPNKASLEEIKMEDVHQAIRIGYTKRREHELDTSLNSVLKDAEKQGLDKNRNIFEFINMRLKTNSAGLEEKHKAFVGALETNIQKAGGKNAFSIFNLAYSNPKALKNNFNLTNEQVFTALAKPEYADNDTLRIIGKVYRELDDQFTKELQDVGMLGDLDDFVVPMTPNPNVIESLGQKGLEDTLTTYTLMTADRAKIVAKQYLDASKKFGPQRAKVSFPKRYLKFREGREGIRDQFMFYKTITGLTDENSGVLERMIHHKEKVLQKAYMYKEFGMHPEETINKIWQKQKKGKVDDELKSMTDFQSKNLKTFEATMGYLPAEYGAVRFYADAINKFISATYGAPQSLPRNFGIDNTMHPMSIKDALINNQGHVGFLGQRIMNPLVQVLSGGLQPKLRRGLNDILNVMDFAQTNNAMFVTQGLRRENFVGDTIDLAGSKSYGEKIGRTLNTMAGKLNYAVQNLAGNVTHYDATTAVNIVNTGTAFSELILKSIDYQHFKKSIGPLGEKYLDWHFGIGEAEFLALKEAYQTIAQPIPTGRVKKILGFQDNKIILPTMLEKMDDSIAERYRKKGETNEAFKHRLRIAYHSMLTHQRNLSQTGLYRANRVVEQGLVRGSFMDIILRAFAPFFNITHAQHYDGLRAGLSMSMYGTPYNTGYSDTLRSMKGISYWTRAFSYYTAGAYVTMALKDTLNGREPRILDNKQTALMIAGSGVGGIPFSIAQQSFYMGGKKKGGYYGESPLGDVIHSTIELFDKMGEDNKGAYRLARYIQKTSGVGKLWWAKGIVDNFSRNTLLREEDRIALEKWYEEEMKSPFYGTGRKE